MKILPGNFLAVAILCWGLSSTTASAAALVWGTGVWGDSWGVSTASSTPSTISGTAFQGPGDPIGVSSASFGIGLSRDNGSTYTSTASVTQDVRILGFITPEAQHLGMLADIFVVDRVNLAFTMKNLSGVFVPWLTGRVSDLVPFREDVILTNNLAVDIYTGKLGVAGDHRIFLGYMPADGTLRYTPTPLRLTISE
jgi:hypothetical protein